MMWWFIWWWFGSTFKKCSRVDLVIESDSSVKHFQNCCKMLLISATLELTPNGLMSTVAASKYMNWKTLSPVCCLQIVSFNILLSSISWVFSRFSRLFSWTRWSLWWSNWSFSRLSWSLSWFSWLFSWSNRSFSSFSWSFSSFSWSFSHFSWSVCCFSWSFSRTRRSLWLSNWSLLWTSWYLSSFSLFLSRSNWSLSWSSWSLPCFSWSLSRSSWSLSEIRSLMSLSDILVILLVESWSELLEHWTAGKENRWEDCGSRIRNTLLLTYLLSCWEFNERISILSLALNNNQVVVSVAAEPRLPWMSYWSASWPLLYEL